MQAHTCPRSTVSKFRLLYLGNDLILIRALRQVLTEPDYQLVTCGDRESAMLFLRSAITYDLLLIDLEWRGKEGVELARLARSLPHRQRMPTILVATELSTAMKTWARKAGIDKCVTKKPDVNGLSQAIRQLTERKIGKGR